MKKLAESRFGRLKDAQLLYLLLVICAVFMVVVLLLYTRIKSVEKMLQISGQEAKEMEQLRDEILQLRKKIPLTAQDTSISEISTALGKTAAKVGLQIGSVDSRDGEKEERWQEYLFFVSAQNVSKNSIVDYLATIERDRPYLKTKDIDMVFKGEQVTTVTIVISYFKRL